MSWELSLPLLLGLIVGSFVNVLIYRLPRMIMSDDARHADTGTFNLCWPSSHCSQCKTPLKIWHNIPVLSYVLLQGRCGFCHQRISPQYPAVELLIAGIWLGSTQHWGVDATGIAWALCFTGLFAASMIDIQTQLLPDDLTLSLTWAGLMASSLGWIDLPLPHAVWGAVLGYASLWSVAFAFEHITHQQGMGAGDFKLLAALGAWLGPYALLPILILSSASGAIVGLWLKSSRRLSSTYVPFGPFLSAAGVVVALMGIHTITALLGWHIPA